MALNRNNMLTDSNGDARGRAYAPATGAPVTGSTTQTAQQTGVVATNPYAAGGYHDQVAAANAAAKAAQAAATTTAPATAQVTTPATTPASTQASSSKGKQTVTYINSAGQKATGVVEAGTSPSYYQAMQDYYQSMYDEQVAANAAALENARTRAQEATDAQLAALAAGYQGTNRQLYRDYMENQRVLPQQMAAQGYSGGLTESSRLRLSNAYQEALAQNERARLGEESSANQALAQQLFEAEASANAANQQAAQNRYSYLAALREAEYQDQQSRAATMASAGDFTEYLNLGYSQSEVDALTRAWLAANPGLVSAWAAAHGADAARLGISAAKAKTSSGGSSRQSTTNQDSEPTPEMRSNEEVLRNGINGAVAGGASYSEIAADIDSMAAAGDISQASVNALKYQAAAALQTQGRAAQQSYAATQAAIQQAQAMAAAYTGAAIRRS